MFIRLSDHVKNKKKSVDMVAMRGKYIHMAIKKLIKTTALFEPRTEKINVKVSKTTHQKLKANAAKDDRSICYEANRAIVRTLQEESK